MSGVLAAVLLAAGGLFFPRAAFASCAASHISIYKDANAGGAGVTLCLSDLSGNFPNLNNISGPCPQFMHADSWNDCVSSVQVSLGWTQCYALYQDANYSHLMVTYWGLIGPDTLFNLSPNDALTSIKQYTKSPATPNGNC